MHNKPQTILINDWYAPAFFVRVRQAAVIPPAESRRRARIAPLFRTGHRDQCEGRPHLAPRRIGRVLCRHES